MCSVKTYLRNGGGRGRVDGGRVADCAHARHSPEFNKKTQIVTKSWTILQILFEKWPNLLVLPTFETVI